MAILTLRNVSKVFGTPDNGVDQVAAVNDVSLEVFAGEFFSIIGPSGCGKSTLLRIIDGLLPATSGEITVGSDRVTGPHPWLGMVFQEESTFPWRTTLGNVEFGLEMRGAAADERRDKARTMLGWSPRPLSTANRPGSFELTGPTLPSHAVRTRVAGISWPPL